MFDFSPNNITITTRGTLEFDSENRKLILNGTNAAFGFADIPALTIGAQEFCFELPGVEFVVAPTSTNIIMGQYDFGNNQRAWRLRYNSPNIELVYSTNGSTTATLSGAWSPSTDTPYDLCVERDDSDVMRIYADGAVLASSTITASINNSTAAFQVGCNFNNGAAVEFANIRLAGLPRLMIGNHRYGGAYTPPDQPWPTQ